MLQQRGLPGRCEGVRREAPPGVQGQIVPSATRRVAARVVELRQARGLSQEALAAKTGLNRVTLARLERAMHPPNLETLERIARALRVSLADLVR
ncbi:MAG: helix-turn-helix transcriptional regulator [Candidatus Rokubacteria bacterium]|nr:helix-turn-helix transcriptional regulator [Candidatus Rokubacteria bacterium]